MAPIISVIALGAMGGAVARKLTESGATVLTNLEGRSEQTRKRAQEAGVVDATLKEIVQRSDFILSILPPRDAFTLAQTISQEVAYRSRVADRQLVYADCNAVNDKTVQRIAELFRGTSVAFVDASIIGGPPKGSYNPTFYASADPEDRKALKAFLSLSSLGLVIKVLDGEGAHVGDASALKMSYAGITKGITGLLATMVLAAHASSPATAEALVSELNASQPEILRRITKSVPAMMPKAYRFVGEMQEIAEFVGEGQGDIHQGMAKLYERVAASINGDGKDIKVLEQFVGAAQKALQGT
ncbi:hypothetical protein D9756_007468 [Leucocoprinus leucothites]|uniref:6-phosphogluconate dehydrogenase n=1 Tax=Leucocoprinus leucothites TaxID=201217 RepID=A0A8H5D1D7_9AGAR|nr:hypothetical protein D9756_007468 [Leucoagaricus leucothites]